MIRILIVTDRSTSVGTRLKLLTVGLALVTAAMAGCSSTTAGSLGAVQDDASASASSSAASTSPAPSPDPVTPSPGPTGATASPTASPTDSPALLGGKNNPYCNSGLEYSCGQVGPGGGIVFLAVSTPFSLSNGYSAACSNNCQFMEAQTALLSPMPWCVGPGATTSVSPGTGAAIGTGYSNTQTMATKSNYCSSGAANAAIESTSGGYTDWFVPSYNEASALNDVLNNDLGYGYCWTSSQSNAKQAYTQPIQGSKSEQNMAKTYNFAVCLARAF